MFKQIFRVAFVTLVWKQYKQAIVSTLLLFAYLWLVGSVHSDYLSYAELQDDDSLAARSFLTKWAAFVAGVVLYLAYHLLRGPTKTPQDIPQDSALDSAANKDRNKRKGMFSRFKSKQQDAGDKPTDEDDPFNNIRNRKKLRSRAEIMIDKKR